MRQALVAGGSLVLAVCTIVSVIYVLRRTPGNDSENRERLHVERLVRSLQRTANKRATPKYRDVTTQNKIANKVPWLLKSKFVPNVYLGRHKDVKARQASPIVFLHQQQTDEWMMRECLFNISFDLDLPMSPVMNMQNRLLWDLGNPNTNSFQNDIKIHRGKYAFGMCERLHIPCSHIGMFQDPVSSAISSYKHCQNNHHGDDCVSMETGKVSIKDWIIDRGSVLFNQFLYSSDLCIEEETKKLNLNISIATNNMLSNRTMPCWLRQKLLLRDLLTDDDVTQLTNYIIEHMTEWFAVTGIYDDIKSSLFMFEKASGLPFTNCTCGHKSTDDTGDNNTGKRNSENENSDESDKEIQDILEDSLVLKSLKPDIRIYKKAKHIFKLQKQILLNKIHI